MAGWLDMLAPAAGGLFRNIMNTDSNPNKVLEVKQDRYSHRPIRCREDAIVLYGPTDNKYEIVMNRPTTESMNKAFSLFRTDNLESAENKFIQLKDKIPVIADVAKETCYPAMLQKMCDALELNPGWSVAHLAAHFDLHTTFGSEEILKFMDASDPNTGLSPLLVAIQSQNLLTIRVLINKNASLEHLDHDANSVFHYAASTNKDIISILTAKDRPKCLNYRNSKGHTPLHMACLSDKPECVKALLLAGADCNISADTGNFLDSQKPSRQPGLVSNFFEEKSHKLYAQDMKHGGTPLHWSCSREVIDTLLDMNCHINALNFDGRSALHIMVLRSRLECVMALLCRGAEINIGDKEGNTPLHLAVKQLNIPIVQALLVFEADLQYKNYAWETARHLVPPDQSSADACRLLYVLHAVGAERCSSDMEKCSPGCAHDGDFNGIPPPPPPLGCTRDALDQMLFSYAKDIASSQNPKRKRCHALCLDGGGVRGLVLIIMLMDLEKAVGLPILHCFDWVAGTSTGGILALGLAVGKSLHECLCLYFRMKDITFVGKRPYPSEPLENLLKDIYGPNTIMAEVSHPKLIITGLLADRKPVDLHIFRNYMSPCEILNEDEYAKCNFVRPTHFQEQLMWRAARASGAAPTFFSAFGRFLDGGLISNNPTLDCITEIHEYNLAMKSMDPNYEVAPVTLVVSLGTGNIPVTELKEIDVQRPDSFLGATKLVFGIAQLGTLIIDQATQSTGRVVDRARSWCSMIGVPFYRFSPQLSEEIDINEKSDEKLVNMVWECKAYMYSQRSVVNELASILKSG
ncbi:85/88 kDa calcium-independent phospholipase A2 [Frankliniella fusca]|uniref:phospholipase A2 n=1 Tax=Frankliniella fusca TaxID=407009 RepID=A0AAE1LFB8_9NEOP|nr:85/88 kDa calcium-independent phospholipase A2 [Frankliniella fusca]